MKIQSAYLQNQIPEKPANIRRKDISASDQFQKIIENHKNKPIPRPEESNEPFQLNEVTQRILSKNEKLAISTFFQNTEGKFAKTYSPQGKNITMEVMIGKKIDVKG